MPEQLQLPLDFGPAPDHFSVTLSVGQLHEEEVIRKHEATTPLNALNLIEGMRDAYRARDGVVWGSEEPNPEGAMYGLAPKGVVYVIRITPAVDFSVV